MDEVVDALSTAWLTGKKTLVFVRRVASVKELEQKLEQAVQLPLAALFGAAALLFVYRSFYGMRIETAPASAHAQPAAKAA